ncbi:MAG TPA: 3'-5' exonuclease [Puia sp.]|nr:3'-5' exonuclease [Puia sp.]
MTPYSLHTILFLDIETVSQYPRYGEVPEDWQELWRRKAEGLTRDKTPMTPEELYDRAAIYAEFGKVICISCGVMSGPPADRRLLLKSFYGDDEKELLTRFWDLLHKWGSEGQKYLCAHNGKDFDFPYLCRRMIIHGLKLPSVLNLAGKKPWEVPHLDTMELWKFGEYKNFTSLNLLAGTLGIPTPKDDIDGSQVGSVYWTDRDLPRIVTYCQKDVVTVAQVYLRLHGEPLIRPENIEIR